MADASAVTPPSGLFGDPGFQNVRAAVNALIDYDIPALRYRSANGFVGAVTASVQATITDSANGAFRLLASAIYKINGTNLIKVGSATAKVWDLSAEAAVAAAKFRAYRLFLDASGTGSFTASGDTTSVSAALLSLDYLAIDDTKGTVADYVAGPSTSFSADSLSGVSGAVIKMGFGLPYSMRSFAVRW